MPAASFGTFVAGIPAALGIGKLQLANGSSVNGSICESIGAADAQNITEYGGWRAWLREAVEIDDSVRLVMVGQAGHDVGQVGGLNGRQTSCPARIG